MGNLQLSEPRTDLAQPETPVLDMLIVLVEERRRILQTTLIALVLGICVALLLRSTFTATATIMPPQEPQSTAAALMGQLGSLAAIGGTGSLLKNPADLYVGILQSRTIADNVLDQFHLQELWKIRKRTDARKRLAKRTSFDAAKDGLIVISVKDHDPRLASDIANAYVDQLYHMNSTLAISEAAQRKVFFDEQLIEEKNALAAAENDLRTTQEKTGLISLTGQAEMAIQNIAQLRAEISSRQVEMQALRSYATAQNPDLVRLQDEIDTLTQQLSRLENDRQSLPAGDTGVPAGRVPQEGLEYERRLREVKYHEALVDLLSRQYEAARIDEAKSAPIIKVVDRAIPPDKKSGPPRTLLALGFAFVGFALACLWAFSKKALVRMGQAPESAAKLAHLSRMLHRRRLLHRHS